MIKIVILTGNDATGKTTIKKALEKKCNYKYFVLDRFTDSVVYNKIFNRNNPSENDILSFESELNGIADVTLVYLKADNKTIIRRLRERKEPVDIDFIKLADKYFEDYLDKTYFDFTTVDTGKLNVEECVSKIINFVENKDVI